ncbi:MAG: hypothetical protein MPW14_10865 [Candidatus Manganitrophus sp.]|nr:MAG: hypothetical protein MPW14_10865 [Candidatus Manganitrophus sp.]
MVCLKGDEVCSVPLTEATRGLKFVPADGERVRAAEALGISFGR